MRTLLLGLAALSAIVATPALAQSQWNGGGGSSSGHRHHDGRDQHDGFPDFRSGTPRLSGDTVAVTEYYGGQWAAYNNQSWRSDSYNDWWHDRPDRAYPRWVQHNQNCTVDRMWWSGSGWHC